MSKGKILVVDDEKEFAITLAERLNIRGFEAMSVHCAEDALALIHARNIPDVVLLDLKMPRMDGMETLGEIKEYDATIEVIILTGHGAINLGVDSLKKGAFDCIMKPVDINELTVKIEKALEKCRRQRQEAQEGV